MIIKKLNEKYYISLKLKYGAFEGNFDKYTLYEELTPRRYKENLTDILRYYNDYLYNEIKQKIKMIKYYDTIPENIYPPYDRDSPLDVTDKKIWKVTYNNQIIE